MIDGREMLTAIRSVIENVTLAVTVVGTLVVLSGMLILIGAVAMTKFRRIYEAAIFKTLGATRPIIASYLLIEYGYSARWPDHRLGGRDRIDLGDWPFCTRHPVAAVARVSPLASSSAPPRCAGRRDRVVGSATEETARYAPGRHKMPQGRRCKRGEGTARRRAARRTAWRNPSTAGHGGGVNDLSLPMGRLWSSE